MLRNPACFAFRVSPGGRHGAGIDRPLSDILAQEGRVGLEALPGIGSHLAFTIEELIRTGEFKTLRPENARIEPNRAVTSLPGVGSMLAYQLRSRLGVTTVDELKHTAQDGRLTELKIAPNRLRHLLDALNGRRDCQPEPPADEPLVDELLAVAEEYRRQAESGQLFTSRRTGTTPKARVGCRCFARTAAVAHIACCSRTRRWRID